MRDALQTKRAVVVGVVVVIHWKVDDWSDCEAGWLAGRLALKTIKSPERATDASAIISGE